MRKGYLVALPPGAGKTRAVLLHLKRQVKGNWVTLCNNLLVLGPNKRVEHVWLRELALLATAPNLSAQKEIRTSTTTLLRGRLAQSCLHLKFLSFSDLQSKSRLQPSAFVVLDEWHRFRGKQASLLAQSSKGPLGNHTYFVSATPLNPVMEQERDILIETPKEDESSIRECREQALSLIAKLNGITISEQILSMPFDGAIRKMGVCKIDRSTGWAIPTNMRLDSNRSWTNRELDYLAQAKGYGSETLDWKSKEAAWAIGLVRTEYDKKSRRFLLKKSHRGNGKTVFGHPYVQPLVVTKSRCSDAAQWLLREHSRIPRLLDMLEDCGVVARQNGSDRYKLTKRKVLIFCVHQGIARGLQLALEAAIQTGKSDISCAVHEFTDEHQNNFMEVGAAPYVLIATDKLSESIDLHGDCRVLVHYELPWSPLRLLQRVGRLTRMHTDKSFRETEVYHIVIPGSVEEERINRLIRRTKLLCKEGAWPKELDDKNEDSWKRIVKALIGAGPSMHLAEKLQMRLTQE